VNIEAGPTGTPAATTQVRYVLDPRLSRLTVRAFASGVLSAFGHNPNIAVRSFTGEVQWQTIETATLRIIAQASSLEVTDNISEKDRREIERQMHEEVLESATYPEIIYECSSLSATKTGEGQYAVVLQGELTLHGVTRSEPISAKVTLTGDLLRAFGDFSLLQTDYGIRLVSALKGALKVKDELKFNFDIVARKQA
jgi:polyisoprenoid-binding protein YceI